MESKDSQAAPAPDSLIALITPLMRRIAAGDVEIYNEFSLQHELGIFLRASFPRDSVQFERNVRWFFSECEHFKKREVDITVFSPDKSSLKWAIELKFPRNGQYPEQMFSFCKDVVFAEQLKAAGFARAGLLIVADHSLFWRGSTEGIYRFFRSNAPLHGVITKPTGAKDDQVEIAGSYLVNWGAITDNLRYAAIEAA